MTNKLLVEAILKPFKLTEKKKKELASSLNLPANAQSDLLFMSAILVSTGTNKNDATFLGSELIKARGSISQKAVDLEHKEDKIIGHIVSAVYMDHDGNVLDEVALHDALMADNATSGNSVAAQLDSQEMDIGVICAIYKDRFPEIADEISKDEWKVSMECYYDDYDLKVGNTIITRDSSAFKKIDDKFNDPFKLIIAGLSGSAEKPSRVLRNIQFCGVGIVKNPANTRSLILEAASTNLDAFAVREGIEAASEVEVTSGMEGLTETADELEVIQFGSEGYLLFKNNSEVLPESFKTDYNEISSDAIKLATLNPEDNFSIIKLDSNFTNNRDVKINETSQAYAYKVNPAGEVKEIHSVGISKENSHLVGNFGPKDRTAGVCVSFKKYVREFEGRPNPGRLLATHWCTLFNKPCPVLGADAQHITCLRNKYTHLVEEQGFGGGTIVETPYNPHTTVRLEDRELLTSKDLPNPGDLGKNAPALKPGQEDYIEIPDVTPAPSVEPVLEVTDTGVKMDMMVEQKPIVMKPPYQQFPIKPTYKPESRASVSERKVMASTDFGLPKQRKFPINTIDRVLYTMANFSNLKNSIKVLEKKELFVNLIKKADTLGLSTATFEQEALKEGFRIKQGTDFDHEFAFPRLKLLPLENKQQVIAAISRYGHMKVEVSEEENKQAVVNILRACSKFEIDTSSFRNRLKIK